MGVVVRLRKEHLEAMIAHALEDAPIECCGVLGGTEGSVVTVRRAKNVEASPYRFSIDPRETMRIENEFSEAGVEMIGFYHSHTGSDPIPSPTDIRSMGPLFGPPFVHFVIGVADRDNPIARVWYIENGDRIEQQYELLD